MKYKQIHLSLCSALFFLASGISEAQTPWWKKGANILTSLTGSSSSTDPSQNEIGLAFKEALKISSESVIEQLATSGGFEADESVRIPIPEKLKTVKSALSRVGMSGPVDDLELKMNQAAETAAPKAKQLFTQAISELSFEDILAIYKGPEDSATQYFREKMAPQLIKEMTPVIDKSLAQVGAINTFNTVMARYKALPLVPKVDADLSNHVVQKTMDGIFHYMAQEEKAIRTNPLKQTTALLKKVFGT